MMAMSSMETSRASAAFQSLSDGTASVPPFKENSFTACPGTGLASFNKASAFSSLLNSRQNHGTSA